MSVLNSISGVSNSISIGGSALSLIGMGTALVTDQNLVKGISGFLFDVPLTENISYSAQITDHFTEDNSSIQDHVALEPLRITLTGKVGELVYTKLAGLTFLSAAIDRLAPLGVFTPEQGLMATQAIAAAYTVASAVNSAERAFNSLSDIFTDEPALNKQQSAFNRFERYFTGRALLSVETPWKTYRNMVIESWSADQSEETTMETTFTLTFKQMRFIQTITNTGKLLGRIAEQASSAKEVGLAGKGGSVLLGIGKAVGAAN